MRTLNYHPRWEGGLVWCTEWLDEKPMVECQSRYIAIASEREWLTGIHEFSLTVAPAS